MQITEQTSCRVCDGQLEVVLDLGSIYPSSFLKEGETVSDDAKAPLVLCKCEKCGLVQLKHTVDLDLMYRQYWYSSSLNKSMVSSLNNIVEEIKGRRVLEPGDDVLDIGCNDGTLLSFYDNGQHSYFKTGFDPALNLAKIDSKACDFFVNDYFNVEAYENERPGINNYKAKVITAIAMFYDLPDPHKFVQDVAKVLHKDGIFVIQFTDLLSMIKLTAFDNICHEHLEYYRLEDVSKLLKAHGLEIIDVSYNNVNGGSLRVTAAHAGTYTPSWGVEEFLLQEFNYLSGHDMDWFRQNVEAIKFKLSSFLQWAKGHGHQVYSLGASTKGNTLLQLCGVTGDLVPYAAEVNKDKFGLRTVGSDIQIISEEEALIKHPDYFIVPVWHFKDSILSNTKIQDYLKSNGRLIFPLPTFTVYTQTGEFEL